MFFKNIQVSGIVTIVFNRKSIWHYDPPTGLWMTMVNPNNNRRDVRPHQEMMFIVNQLKTDRRYRMWIHGDTLNIVKKGE